MCSSDLVADLTAQLCEKGVAYIKKDSMFTMAYIKKDNMFTKGVAYIKKDSMFTRIRKHGLVDIVLYM